MKLTPGARVAVNRCKERNLPKASRRRARAGGMQMTYQQAAEYLRCSVEFGAVT